MIRALLRHQWLQFRRSSSYERELGLTIFIWIITLLVLIQAIALAIALPKFITEIPEIGDPIAFVNHILIYYYLGELLMRYLMQKIPVLDVQPYLGHPIKRSTIANFLIGKSVISVFNIFSLILTLPFAIQTLKPVYGTLGIVAWLSGIFLMSLLLHFFNILFKKKLEEIPVVWVIIIVLASANYFLSVYYNVDLFKPFGLGFMALLTLPSTIFIPLLVLAVLIYITLKFFRENLYLEELGNDKNQNIEKYSEKLSFLGNSSLSNTLILQEVKMILRHKRTRSVLILSLLFAGYGLIFFGKDNYQGNKAFFIFLGIFMSGIFPINYGQFFWSWNTNQLDFFLTKPIALHTWLKSRYRLIVASCVICTIICVPYVYFGWDILLIILAGSFYNIGINIPLMMRLSMWGPKPIDLNKGAFMNYQGTGAAQWLMSLPLLIGPYIVFIPVNIFFGFIPAIICIGIAGIIGFTLQDYFIRLIVHKLDKVKYKMVHDLTL
ncbi:MAG TPA: DUF5687 family protein [Fulvivirga sp.]|nr:DUF5687 family protein [Fulvivirga sp.]